MDSESSKPTNVGSNDQLGPLPEPAAWQCYWRGDNDSVSWDQWHDAGDPMPAKWDDDPPDEVTPHYTADQMRAYAAQERAAERERCAKLCEQTGSVMCEIYGDGAECIATADACADAIRGA